MRRFLIATHGAFAAGIAGSAALIIGAHPELSTITGYLTDDFDLNAAIAPHLERMEPGDELIVMTDIAGGSVNNGFMMCLNRPGVHVITGMNLPLVLSILSSDPEDDVATVISEAVQMGRDGIIYCNEMVQEDDDSDF